jgi:hypothetical protein
MRNNRFEKFLTLAIDYLVALALVILIGMFFLAMLPACRSVQKSSDTLAIKKDSTWNNIEHQGVSSSERSHLQSFLLDSLERQNSLSWDRLTTIVEEDFHQPTNSQPTDSGRVVEFVDLSAYLKKAGPGRRRTTTIRERGQKQEQERQTRQEHRSDQREKDSANYNVFIGRGEVYTTVSHQVKNKKTKSSFSFWAALICLGTLALIVPFVGDILPPGIKLFFRRRKSEDNS